MMLEDLEDEKAAKVRDRAKVTIPGSEDAYASMLAQFNDGKHEGKAPRSMPISNDIGHRAYTLRKWIAKNPGCKSLAIKQGAGLGAHDFKNFISWLYTRDLVFKSGGKSSSLMQYFATEDELLEYEAFKALKGKTK